MKMNDDEETEETLKKSQAVRAAIHFSVGKTLEGIAQEYGAVYSKPVIATISEFINRQIETYANDLEAFAKHARRTNINCDDVKLLTRRNPKLKETIRDLSDVIEATGSEVGQQKIRVAKSRKRLCK